jgi:hypothetical protein
LNNFSDGFGYERRIELFLDSGVVGFEKFSEAIRDFDDKGEGPFEQEGNGGHLCEDIGSWAIKDSGFVEDFKVFLHSAVGSFRSGPHFLEGIVTFGSSGDFIH